MACSSISMWPVRDALLAMMAWFPTLQSWAMWTQAISKLWLPTYSAPTPLTVSTANRYTYPNGIVIADSDSGGFAAILQILECGPRGGNGKDPVVLADPGVAVDRRMQHHFRALTEFDALADQGERTDCNVAAQPRTWMNTCGGMNIHGVDWLGRSASANSSKASAANLPSTNARADTLLK